MGADFNIKPVGAPVAAPFIRPAPDAARYAVPTELPPSRSVTASSRSSDSGRAASYNSLAESDRISRQIVVDRAAAEIVYVSVDKNTSQVIDQYPEASKLRARAYIRAQDNAKLDNKVLATDRRI